MNSFNWKFIAVFVLLSISLSACAAQPPVEEVFSAPTITVPTADQPDISPSNLSTSLGLTYQQPDGNRLVHGKGMILDAEPITIELSGVISWLVGLPFGEGSLWTAALKDGKIESFTIQDRKVSSIDTGRGPLAAGTPLMMVAHEGGVNLNSPPSPEASVLTHPVSLDPERARVVFITKAGDLVLWDQGDEISRLKINALPDARLIQDEQGRLLFLSDPTDRYDHGVLGDGLEAASITLVETDPELKLVSRIEIPAPKVIEGIAPIWVDLDGDGVREILVTISDHERGAGLVLYNEAGLILAEGPVAGQGYRWRHQLAAAPLGPEGQMTIVDVLRPHLDATLEFFSWEADQLVLKSELPGFSTHMIGSRNLDMTMIGDLDGDGRFEVVVPGPGRETLHGIGFGEGIIEVIWTVPLDGQLTSNIAGVTLADGSLVLGAGVGENLVVWE